MLIIKAKSYKEISKIATEILIDDILRNPKSVIGFATGKTPLGLYKELTKAYKKKRINFSKIISFNLDEYYPITKQDKNSYNYYMHKNLFNKINIKKSNINMLNGTAKNIKKECENYEKKIKKNPIDIQILGVGTNGHIGFNEPQSKPNSKTRIVNLSKETIKKNSGFLKNKIPEKALTIGIKTIMSSKKIILLASGKNKAKAINKLVNGKIDKNYPVTYLKNHKNLIIIIDKKAGSLL